MKMKCCIAMVLLAAMTALAQTNNLTTLLQQGLFEEQANRNLAAAITDYAALATQFDKNRQIAATAVFRLGECYRALGRTNEAAGQYQRILRDFSDQSILVNLSQQNLAGMGLGAARPEPAMAASESADAQLLKKLDGKTFDELEKLLPTLMPNTTLDALIKQRGELEAQRAMVLVDYAPDNVQVKRVDAQLEFVKDRIGKTIAGMMQALKLRAEISPSPGLSQRTDLQDLSVPVSSEEDQEITRIQQMIQNSPDLINAPAANGATPLQSAATMGRLKVVSYLLDHGAAIDTEGIPALCSAAESGNRAMVELLLSRGAHVDAAQSDGLTALHLAAAHGYLSVVEALLSAKADVNARASNQQTPLTMAAENRAVYVAATLLAHGADPNISGIFRRSNGFGTPNRKEAGTPLQLAVALQDVAMVTLLLTNHSDLTLRNYGGESPLDIAAIVGDTGIARQLVAAGADVNAICSEDQGRFSPLHRAAASGSRDIVALLLDHGANPNVQEKNGGTPLMSAVLGNNGRPGLDSISLLLQHKADPNLVNSDGDVVLMMSVRRQFPAEVKALLAGGANPDVRTKDGYPALVVAVSYGDKDVVAALLDAKANVNAADTQGKAPLHYAADKNRPDLVGLLIKAGADVNLRTKNGETPLNYVRSSRTSSGGIPMPKGLSSNQSQNSPAGSETASPLNVADILHQNGALDELPDFTRIRITRQGLSSPVVVFGKGSLFTNQFTLLETVMRFYSRSPAYVPGVSASEAWLALPFPDFGRLTIHRPGQKIGSKEQEIKVNLFNQSNVVDCARDVTVQFGDVIEIPESVHALNAGKPNPVYELEMAARLPPHDSPLMVPVSERWLTYKACLPCLQKSVQLVVGGETTSFKVDSWKEGFLSQALQKVEARSALRSSSDLSRVQVTRHTGKSAKPAVLTVDLSSLDSLWLQDGDVIEVPDKQ